MPPRAPKIPATAAAALCIDEVLAHLTRLCPLQHAADFDNVGLLCGDGAAACSGVLFTIDATSAVVAEAQAAGCNLLVAYHPPLFTPLKRLPAAHPVAQALALGLAVFSPHTAWDAAPQGPNAQFAQQLGLQNAQILVPSPARPQPAYKLVYFVPQPQAAAVAHAVFAAGAGHIGDYSACSFSQAGEGTFEGGPSSNPTLGQRGVLQTVSEQRVEVRVAEPQLPAVVAALKAAHPYEEVAFDVYPLHQLGAEGDYGFGRIGSGPQRSLRQLADEVKQILSVPQLLVCGDAQRPVRRIAIAVGAGESCLQPALAAGAEVFISGELKHHAVLAAQAAGMAVILTRHSACERPFLPLFVQQLQQAAAPLRILLSKQDREPLDFV